MSNSINYVANQIQVKIADYVEKEIYKNVYKLDPNKYYIIKVKNFFVERSNFDAYLLGEFNKNIMINKNSYYGIKTSSYPYRNLRDAVKELADQLLRNFNILYFKHNYTSETIVGELYSVTYNNEYVEKYNKKNIKFLKSFLINITHK